MTWKQHREAVAALQASYAAIPVGMPVRLAKATTNLFRERSASSQPGLDVSGLDGVIAIDPVAQVAEVQGMCTYEDLVSATLAHHLMPTVVPQLRTITVGGAVTGLGVESTSLRNGLPHEAVLEMEILTGAGDLVTVVPGDELFDSFPNSYGSLGYATRLRLQLQPAPAYVGVRHVRFDSTDSLTAAVALIASTGTWEGTVVDGIDGTGFRPGEYYLTLAQWISAGEAPFTRPHEVASEYTGQRIYYRSIQTRTSDLLTISAYLWRWDTDWFWCSRAFGAQHRVIRWLWPRSLRRSDVYMKLVKLDRKHKIADRLDDRAGRLRRERVVQDVELPLATVGEFLDWFDAEIGMRPVWLCPLRVTRRWPCYPLEPDQIYVNVGFWGTVHVGESAPNAPMNRAIEAKVLELGGHKSLYSESYYDRETFDRLYHGEHLAKIKAVYDPDDRLTSLYDKAVRAR